MWGQSYEGLLTLNKHEIKFSSVAVSAELSYGISDLRWVFIDALSTLPKACMEAPLHHALVILGFVQEV